MKKLIVAVAVLSVFWGGVLAAQESNTSISTAGIFGNDVDDFMSVTSWSEVQPENVFAFLGIGRNGLQAYDLGLAHQFEKFYLAGYFSGDFGNYSSTKMSAGGNSVTQKNSADTDDTNFEFAALLGIKNIGIRAGFKYYDSNSSEDGTDDTKVENQAFQINASVGTSFDKDGTKLSPYGKIWFGYNYNEADEGFADANANGRTNRGSKVRNGTNTVANDLGFLGGVKIDLAKKATAQHSFDLSAALDIDMPKGSTGAYVGLFPYYTITYEPEEKFGAGVSFGIPAKIGFGDGFFGFDVKPEINTGVYYQATQKLRLNAGAEFAIIGLSYSHTEAGGLKTDTWTWDGDDGNITLESGFNFAFNEKVALDFEWQILRAVLNGFRTTFDDTATNANGAHVFFSNLNKIFTNMGFIVTAKF